MEAGYLPVPATVLETELGESLRVHVPAAVPVASCAAQLPECPPAALVSVAPVTDPEVFHPVSADSKPGLVTRFGLPMTCAVAVVVLPAVSFTVTVTV